MARTTKEVAEFLGLKSREVTTYAKKYGLLPSETFGGMPVWEDADVIDFRRHKEQMDAGHRCSKCGRLGGGDGPAEILASDEPTAEVQE